MCGILLTHRKNQNVEEIVNPLLTNRGPDNTSFVENGDYLFLHTLLSMTGDFVKQPITQDDNICIFNGEIYNHKDFGDYSSDVFSILESYKHNKARFASHLDGEFAIVLADFKEKKINFCTDVFGIKPLYYSVDDGHLSACSYKEILYSLGCRNILKAEPNKVFTFCLNKKQIISEQSIHDFNLNQFETSYDKWSELFLEAIKKRFLNTQHDIILPLSSGHDSGGISCALNMLGVDHYTFSFLGNEHKQILQQRFEFSKNKDKIFIKDNLSAEEKQKAYSLLYENSGHFTYGKDILAQNQSHDGFKDAGALGLTILLWKMKEMFPTIRILASGQGGDEVMSTIQGYGFGDKFNPPIFPEELNTVFPWNNFYYGAQSSYLSKEESVTGAFGIEGRFPFLDVSLVQSFLNLVPELKNKEFKAPLTNFMKENSYPVLVGENPKVYKRGFNV
jgi:asparagine synthetase B (glutamine-hydrolysing)|tara:strand:- start:1652 stop:2995 length:1344 start_codon:yes stop_codon:yes gene_type:complete